MATIITPGGSNDTGTSATIWVVGLIVLLLIGLFAFFVWPNLSNQAENPQTNNQNPPANNTYNTTTNTPPVVNNTTINATSTTNNSTTTRP